MEHYISPERLQVIRVSEGKLLYKCLMRLFISAEEKLLVGFRQIPTGNLPPFRIGFHDARRRC
jgi:hypothetical protein